QPPRLPLLPYTTLFRSDLWGKDLCTGTPLFHPGHPEPHRTVRHLCTAGGPTGPLSALYQDRLPHGRRGGADPSGDHGDGPAQDRSEEHTSELQSRENLV